MKRQNLRHHKCVHIFSCILNAVFFLFLFSDSSKPSSSATSPRSDSSTVNVAAGKPGTSKAWTSSIPLTANCGRFTCRCRSWNRKAPASLELGQPSPVLQPGFQLVLNEHRGKYKLPELGLPVLLLYYMIPE